MACFCVKRLPASTAAANNERLVSARSSPRSAYAAVHRWLLPDPLRNDGASRNERRPDESWCLRRPAHLPTDERSSGCGLRTLPHGNARPTLQSSLVHQVTYLNRFIWQRFQGFDPHSHMRAPGLPASLTSISGGKP